MANLHKHMAISVMFTLGFMNIHQVISILRTIWTWVCSLLLTIYICYRRCCLLNNSSINVECVFIHEYLKYHRWLYVLLYKWSRYFNQLMTHP